MANGVLGSLKRMAFRVRGTAGVDTQRLPWIVETNIGAQACKRLNTLWKVPGICVAAMPSSVSERRPTRAGPE